MRWNELFAWLYEQHADMCADYQIFVLIMIHLQMLLDQKHSLFTILNSIVGLIWVKWIVYVLIWGLCFDSRLITTAFKSIISNSSEMVVCSELPPDCNNNAPVPNAEFFKNHQFGNEFGTLERNKTKIRGTNGNSNGISSNNNNTTIANNNNIIQDENDYDTNRYSIKSFYRNTVVLVTGGTGFLGKVLIEKLLRSCDNIRCVYVLLRPKRGLSSEQRHKELLQNPVFDRIRAKNADLLKKIVFIAGDIAKPNIGLSNDDLIMLKENVNIIFHSAATVRFDQSIKDAVIMNTLGSKRLWDLCTEMKNLRSIIHVSTAYTNPNRQYVGESVYPPQIAMSNEAFMTCVNALPDDLVHSIATTLQVRKHILLWHIMEYN